MNKTKEGKASVHQNLRAIFKAKKKPMRAWHLQAFYLEMFGKRYSESSITARLREMLDVSCNLTDYTYMLIIN
jgi:hypothetical protein